MRTAAECLIWKAANLRSINLCILSITRPFSASGPYLWLVDIIPNNLIDTKMSGPLPIPIHDRWFGFWLCSGLWSRTFRGNGASYWGSRVFRWLPEWYRPYAGKITVMKKRAKLRFFLFCGIVAASWLHLWDKYWRVIPQKKRNWFQPLSVYFLKYGFFFFCGISFPRCPMYY